MLQMRVSLAKRTALVGLAALLLVAPTATLSAHSGANTHGKQRPHHSVTSGRPSTQVADNFEVLGRHDLGGGSAHGDIYFFDHGGSVGQHVYVGTWGSQCTGHGVKILDVNDPSGPRLVGLAGRQTGVSNEDIVVQRVGAIDVLAVGVQPCSSQGGVGGLALFDVTDPSDPQRLSFMEFPYGVHELDMVVRDDGKALALLAVPFTEFENIYFGENFGGEFKIVEVTDPSNPVLRSDWGIIADSDLPIVGGNDEVGSSFQGIGDYAAYYAHSARAADSGRTAYVSYWDGGILKFDISNPSAPELLGRTIYPLGADGDGHSMTPYDVGGTRYVLQNDEDTAPWSSPLVTSSATGTHQYPAIEEPWMPQLLSEVGTVSGTVHDANDGCEASDFAGAQGKIALVDVTDPFYVGIIDGWDHPCTIGSQVLLAIDAGAMAMLSNLISPDDAWPFFRSGSKMRRQIAQSAPDGFVVVQVSDIDELADEIRAASGNVTVTLTPTIPSHGYLRVFSEAAASDADNDGVDEYAEVGHFRDLANVYDELDPPAGTWTIHNTEVLGDRAYAAWFSHGIVALDLANPTSPSYAGQFVPPTNQRFAGALGVGTPEMWGVAIDPDTGIVYGSDMRTGLWIVKPTGPAAPSG